MTSKKPPPPESRIEVGTAHTGFGRIYSAPPGMSDVKLTFADEFSPSHAQAFSSDPNALSNPAARHLFYNQHLYEFLKEAINCAVRLGLPPIDVGFPLTFDRIAKDTFAEVLRISNALSPYILEGSPSWMCVQIYVRHAQICNHLHDPLTRKVEAFPGESEESLAFRQRGCDAVLLVSYAFFLGAATRELELSVLNKQDALRGKKTVRSARAGGKARKSAISPDTDRRILAMLDYLSAGHSASNAARLTAQKIGGTADSNLQLLKRARKK